MNNVTRRIAAALAAGALLLAGCVTPGGYGGYPGGYGQPGTGYPSPSQYGSQLEGTVERVDGAYGRLVLRVDDWRSNNRGQQVEVRYDRNLRLYYQGREYPLDGLERGDVVRVNVVESGRDLWVQSIQLVRNVRDSGYGGDYGDDYGQDLRGQVAFVDPRARLIHLDNAGYGYGGSVQVRYDSRTTVEYQRRLLRPEDLGRGDTVRIQARRIGGNEWMAERIYVERPAGYY